MPKKPEKGVLEHPNAETNAGQLRDSTHYEVFGAMAQYGPWSGIGREEKCLWVAIGAIYMALDLIEKRLDKIEAITNMHTPLRGGSVGDQNQDG